MIVNVGLVTSSGDGAEPAGQAAHERGLAGAELAVEEHDRAWRQRGGELLAGGGGLVFARAQ